MMITEPKPKKATCFSFWPFWTKLFVLSFVTFHVLSCTKEGTISLNNTNDQLGAEIADSITVRAATYQLDPLPANGQGVMLAGKISDEVAGDLTVSSYFRIGNAEISNVSLPSDASLDSVSFALPYQGYYYGDTVMMQSLAVHKVTEDIELIAESNAWEEDERPVFASGSTLFTNSSFNYDAAALGSVNFYPKPTSKDTVFIKLAHSFGQDLWEKIKNKTSQVTSSEEFLQYMKGFVLTPANEASVLTAFPVDSILLNVYYSYTRTTDGKKVQENIQMKATDNSYQFNNVQVDRSRSIISQLPADAKGELPASETGQQVLLQGLTGLVVKVQFPYLYEFVNRNDVIINKAELIVETPASSQVPYTAPTALNIMLANKYGVPTSLLTASYETTTQTAYLINDLSGGASNGRYTFNLTEYVSNYRGAEEDKNSSLYVTIPTSDLLIKADRLLIGSGDGRPMIKLRLLYTKY